MPAILTFSAAGALALAGRLRDAAGAEASGAVLRSARA
jgi:hypothetical protein